MSFGLKGNWIKNSQDEKLIMMTEDKGMYCVGLRNDERKAMMAKLEEETGSIEWGCVAHVLIHPKKRKGKLAAKSKTMIFVGYSEDSKAWRFVNPTTGKVHITDESRDVRFDEHLRWQDVKDEVSRYGVIAPDLERDTNEIYETKEAFLDDAALEEEDTALEPDGAIDTQEVDDESVGDIFEHLN